MAGVGKGRHLAQIGQVARMRQIPVGLLQESVQATFGIGEARFRQRHTLAPKAWRSERDGEALGGFPCRGEVVEPLVDHRAPRETQGRF